MSYSELGQAPKRRLVTLALVLILHGFLGAILLANSGNSVVKVIHNRVDVTLLGGSPPPLATVHSPSARQKSVDSSAKDSAKQSPTKQIQQIPQKIQPKIHTNRPLAPTHITPIKPAPDTPTPTPKISVSKTSTTTPTPTNATTPTNITPTNTTPTIPISSAKSSTAANSAEASAPNQHDGANKATEGAAQAKDGKGDGKKEGKSEGKSEGAGKTHDIRTVKATGVCTVTPQPKYPPSAFHDDISGKVTVRFRVNDDGHFNRMVTHKFNGIEDKYQAAFLQEINRALAAYKCDRSLSEVLIETVFVFNLD